MQSLSPKSESGGRNVSLWLGSGGYQGNPGETGGLLFHPLVLCAYQL